MRSIVASGAGEIPNPAKSRVAQVVEEVSAGDLPGLVSTCVRVFDDPGEAGANLRIELS